MLFLGSSQNGPGGQHQAGPGGEIICGVRNEGGEPYNESNIDVCFDLDVRTDDFVALFHHQFYSTKMLAIATCETDTDTVTV